MKIMEDHQKFVDTKEAEGCKVSKKNINKKIFSFPLMLRIVLDCLKDIAKTWYLYKIWVKDVFA